MKGGATRSRAYDTGCGPPCQARRPQGVRRPGGVATGAGSVPSTRGPTPAACQGGGACRLRGRGRRARKSARPVPGACYSPCGALCCARRARRRWSPSTSHAATRPSAKPPATIATSRVERATNPDVTISPIAIANPIPIAGRTSRTTRSSALSAAARSGRPASTGSPVTYQGTRQRYADGRCEVSIRLPTQSSRVKPNTTRRTPAPGPTGGSRPKSAPSSNESRTTAAGSRPSTGAEGAAARMSGRRST